MTTAVATAAAPTKTEGDFVALSTDLSGNLRVVSSGGGGGGGNVNLTQVNSSTVATGHGTAAGALRVELPTDGTGIVGLAVGTTVAVSSSALPTGAATAANQTNVQSAAGTPDSTVLNVQGNASGVPLPVSGTVAATQSGSWTISSSALPTGAATSANQTATQGAVAPGTAATSSDLVGGVYTSAGVTLTNGQQVALQLGVNGGLLVSGVIASGSTDTGNPVKVGGRFNTTSPTLTDGQRGDVQLDSRGSTKVALTGSNGAVLSSSASADGLNNANTGMVGLSFNSVFNGTTWDRLRSGGVTGMVGVNQQASSTGGYSFNNISTNATTTVKSGAGTLHTITVNNPGTTETLTIYDNTAGSGTKIGTVAVGTNLATLTFDIAFATGLTIVSAGTSTGDWTVSYK